MEKRLGLRLRSCVVVLSAPAWLLLNASCSGNTDPNSRIDGIVGGGKGGAPGASSGAPGGGAAASSRAGAATNPVATGGSGQMIGLPLDGSNPGGALPQDCGAEAHEAQQKPLAMYLLVDQSSSMTQTQDRWTPVSTAIQAFVTDPSSGGIKVAVGYFPAANTNQTLKCDATHYATPDVPMGILPDNSAAIVSSLAAKIFPVGQSAPDRTSTPTRPAYDGSLSYLSGWLQQNPDHVGVMVLATDGEPTQCTTNAIQNVVSSIARANSGTPQIRTYVIGIGSEGNLTQFAAAGGTGHAPFIVDGTGVNTQADFLQAMQAIRGAALPCEFAIPMSKNGTQDINKVNVDYQPGTGAAAIGLVRVPDAAGCSQNGNGWYYDNPAAPKSILLCPGICSGLGTDQGAKISIALGCDTRIP